jgi:hypothetical protein
MKDPGVDDKGPPRRIPTSKKRSADALASGPVETPKRHHTAICPRLVHLTQALM